MTRRKARKQQLAGMRADMDNTWDALGAAQEELQALEQQGGSAEDRKALEAKISRLASTRVDIEDSYAGAAFADMSLGTSVPLVICAVAFAAGIVTAVLGLLAWLGVL